MVLDYNKVNTQKRNTSESIGSRDSESYQPNKPTTTNIRNEPIFAVDQECDVALITEEVIDGKSRTSKSVT